MSSESKRRTQKELRARLAERSGKSAAPTPPEPEEEELCVETEEETEGYVLFSKLFGMVPPSGGDFLIRVFDDEDWEPEDIAYIPDLGEFSDFVLDYELIEAELRALRNNLRVLVVGPTGSGKTTLQKYIAAVTRQPYLRINCRQDMDADTIIGKPWVSGGSMHFELGEFPKAMQRGWFVTIDEPWKAPAGIWMCLQRPLEHGGVLQLDDMPGGLEEKQIVPKDTFKLVLCDNVVGTGDGSMKYGATMIQDGSTLNRIDIVLQMNYLNPEKEADMLHKMHPEISDAKCLRMVQLANEIRKGYEMDEYSAAVSPRNLFAWGLMYKELGSLKQAFEVTIGQRYAEEAEHQSVLELYRNVFGA